MKLINFTCDVVMNVSINTKKTTNALVVKSVDTKDLKAEEFTFIIVSGSLT